MDTHPHTERTSNGFIRACSSIGIICFLAFVLQIVFFSPISPDPLEVPLSLSSSAPLYPTYNHLQSVIKIGESQVRGPEDVCVDKEGVLYTATRDGWIKRLHKNGTLEDWKLIKGDTLLGLAITMAGDLLVCDSERGLLKVSEDGVTVLASSVNGSKIRLADDVIAASDGSAYFSVASTKFDLQDWYLDVLEAKPHGQLLKFDPTTNETSIILDNLAFANGVALSRDQDYLVVCELWKFRCLKYWLKGENKGSIEIFIENLPGAPDNINLAPDGSFWIALVKLTSDGMEFVHKSKMLKHLLATFPKSFNLIMGMNMKATVIKVTAGGEIIRKLEDPTGKVISFVTSAVEHDGHLYLASLNSNFIGKLQLRPELYS